MDNSVDPVHTKSNDGMHIKILKYHLLDLA